MLRMVITILFGLQVVFAFSQTSTGVQGKVFDSKTQTPLKSVLTTVRNTNLAAFTNDLGSFFISDVPIGTQILQISSAGYQDQYVVLEIEAGKILDIGLVLLDEDVTVEKQLSLISITDLDLSDDNSGSETSSGLLQASKDAYQQAAAFNWGQARFRTRGLDNEYGITLLNGVEMNKLYDGRPQWNNFGGLNDAIRNQEFTSGSMATDYTFGNILGTQEITTQASIYKKGTRLSFSGANTSYNWRTMITHASGMNTKGWAYVISASKRGADEGYFEGTNYDANSLFTSIEKTLGSKHSLNFTAIYAKNRRGKNSPNTNEVTQLTDDKYNSYWGWQEGKKRNSRVKDVDEPIFMLTHYWKLSEKTNLHTNVMHQFGQVGNSRLGYQGADNPDPTYYKNLPSFYTSAYNPDDYTDFWGDRPENIANGLAAKTLFLKNKQLNWAQLYQTNITSDGHSAYILYEDRTDDKLWVANSLLGTQLSDNISLNAGVHFSNLKSHNFQNLLDLLGGKFYEDYTPFQVGSEQESDLNNPNRRVVEGETFGYNYNLAATVFKGFTQFRFTYKKIDFYLAQTYMNTQYQREGLYKNGIYPNNSFAKSDPHIFENFGFKGGLVYKDNARQFLVFNAAYLTKAPTLRNIFPNARLNNISLDAITSERIANIDGSYIFRTPTFKTRLTVFYATINNATETSFFFGEGIFDDENGNGGDAFVVESLTGINKQNVGMEMGMEYRMSSTTTVSFSGAYGQYIYNNNPNVYLGNDNFASDNIANPIIDLGRSYLKGYRQSNGPQAAASLGLEYRNPANWWIGANANYLANNYIAVSSIVRTNNFYKNPSDLEGLSFPESNALRGKQLLTQEQLGNVLLCNMVGGKSWQLKKNRLGFFASLNNIFNVSYKTGGFEQARNANYRELNQDVSSGTPSFGPKYFYGYGRTYFVNCYFNF